MAISRWYFRSRSKQANGVANPPYAKRPLFYLVDWLPPDFGAVGQYGLYFSRELAEGGREVHLIGLSSSATSVVAEQFERGSLTVKRLRATPFRKTSSVQRLLWAAGNNIRLIWVAVKDPRFANADLIFTGSPPFILYFSFLAKTLMGCRLIYRITDFYPEVLFAAWGRKPVLFRPIERITWFLRRHVDEFQVLGEDQRRRLLAGGIDPERITLKRDVAPFPISTDEAPARRPSELEGFHVILYSGNFGVAHDVATLREGLLRHHREGSRRFGLWLNASGSAVDDLANSLRAEGIPVAVTPPCPLHSLPGVLAAADVHLITLKANFVGYVLPSKIYGCLSSRRPILFVGPKSSDIHLLCREDPTLLYRHVDNADAEAFAVALEELADLDYRTDGDEKIAASTADTEQA